MTSVIRLVMPLRREPITCNTEILVKIIYLMLAKYPEYGCERIIIPFLHLETEIPTESRVSETASSIQKAEQMIRDSIVNPGRLIVFLKAFLLLLADVEQATKTQGNSYAVENNDTKPSVFVEGKLTVPVPDFPDFKTLTAIAGVRDSSKRKINCEISPDYRMKMGSAMRSTLDVINEHVGRVLTAYFEAVGHFDFFDYTYSSTEPLVKSSSLKISNSRADALQGLNALGLLGPVLGPGIDMHSVHRTEIARGQLSIELLKVVLDSLPRYSPVGITPTRILEMGSRLMLHVNEDIQKSAKDALLRIARIIDYNCPSNYNWKLGLESTLAASASSIPTKHITSFLVQRYKELWKVPYDLQCKALVNLGNVYIESLQIYHNDLANRKPECGDHEIEKLVQMIELRGLIFLVQREPQLRKQGMKVIEIACEFETELIKHQIVQSSKPRNAVPFDASLANLALLEGLAPDLTPNFVSERRVARFIAKCGRSIVESAIQQYQKPSPRPQHESSVLKSISDPILHIASSPAIFEANIWMLSYPELFRRAVASKNLQKCFLEEVWNRLHLLQPFVVGVSDDLRRKLSRSLGSSTSLNGYAERKGQTQPLSAGDQAKVIEQWGIYVSIILSQDLLDDSASTRSSATSRSATLHSNDSEHVNSTYEGLISKVVPLLVSREYAVRHAVGSSLRSINPRYHQTLLHELKPILEQLSADIPQTLAERDALRTASEWKRIEITLSQTLKVISAIPTLLTFPTSTRNNMILMRPIQVFINAIILYLKSNTSGAVGGANVDVSLKDRIKEDFCLVISWVFQQPNLVFKDGDQPDLRKTLLSLIYSWQKAAVASSTSAVMHSHSNQSTAGVSTVGRTTLVPSGPVVGDTIRDIQERKKQSVTRNKHLFNLLRTSTLAICSLISLSSSPPTSNTYGLEAVNDLRSVAEHMMISNMNYTKEAIKLMQILLEINGEACLASAYTCVNARVLAGYAEACRKILEAKYQPLQAGGNARKTKKQAHVREFEHGDIALLVLAIANSDHADVHVRQTSLATLRLISGLRTSPPTSIPAMNPLVCQDEARKACSQLARSRPSLIPRILCGVFRRVNVQLDSGNSSGIEVKQMLDKCCMFLKVFSLCRKDSTSNTILMNMATLTTRIHASLELMSDLWQSLVCAHSNPDSPHSADFIAMQIECIFEFLELYTDYLDAGVIRVAQTVSISIMASNARTTYVPLMMNRLTPDAFVVKRELSVTSTIHTLDNVSRSGDATVRCKLDAAMHILLDKTLYVNKLAPSRRRHGSRGHLYLLMLVYIVQMHPLEFEKYVVVLAHVCCLHLDQWCADACRVMLACLLETSGKSSRQLEVDGLVRILRSDNGALWDNECLLDACVLLVAKALGIHIRWLKTSTTWQNPRISAVLKQNIADGGEKGCIHEYLEYFEMRLNGIAAG